MRWWDDVAGITPLAVFDSFTPMISDVSIEDSAGLGLKLLNNYLGLYRAANDVDASTSVLKSINLREVLQNSSLSYDKDIPMPEKGLLIAYLRPLSDIVLNVQKGRAETFMLAFRYGDCSWYSAGAIDLSLKSSFDWQVVAIRWNADKQQIYLNGKWFNSEKPFLAANRAEYLSGAAYGFNFGLNANFAVYALFSGEISLDDIIKLEGNIRREFKIGKLSSRIEELPQALILNRFQPKAYSANLLEEAPPRYNFWQREGAIIKGIVTIENIPASRKVRLYEKANGRFIDETWSKEDGSYQFYNLDANREYFAVAHDHERVYNAVIQDMLIA